MNRLAVALIGSFLITTIYGLLAVTLLGMIVMSHCALSDIEIAQGATCVQLADIAFWPVLLVEVVVFIAILAGFLRWTLKRR
jgi:hypothetical protein